MCVRATLLFLLLPVGVLADRPINPPGKRPDAGRPFDFSWVEGSFTLEVSAAPTENLFVEDPIRLELRLIGSGPKEGEPDRKHMRNLFPASIDRDFYVQELRDEHKVLRDEKTWLFVYRLKPRHANVKAIDDFKLVYYDGRYGDKGYITAPRPDPIPLKVKQRPDDKPPPIEFDPSVPSSFYEETTGRAQEEPFTLPSPTALMFFLGLIPVLCLVGALVYRELWPDALVRARRFREAAAQRALAKLRAGDPPWLVVERYLHERFDFPSTDATPAEVAAFLKRRGFNLARCEHAHAFFEACDAARFLAAGVAPPSYDAAERLIQALEADPCARV